jgi:flagellar biosynthesis protein FlhG
VVDRGTADRERLDRDGPWIVALGGGKGGVGKTFVAANLAALLARSGLRVVALDTDLEGANLHTWLGVPRPSRSLAEFAAGRESDVAKLLVATPLDRLDLIAATGADLAAPQPRAPRRAELVQGLARLPHDVVVVDCGAGSHPTVIDYFLAGHESLLLVHPEPTSIENAYAFLRAAFYRRMQLALLRADVRQRVREAMDQRNERGIRTPLDLMREVTLMDEGEGRRFAQIMAGFRPRIVVNEVHTSDDVKLGFSMRSVCRKYFGLDADYLGYVSHDPLVRDALRARRLLVEAHPKSDAAVYLRRIAQKLAQGIGGRGRRAAFAQGVE